MMFLITSQRGPDLEGPAGLMTLVWLGKTRESLFVFQTLF